MDSKRLNCWEFMECGRESGGAKSKELGVCPVTNVVKLNGVHNGWNGGRACWIIAGSMCGGEVQGTFARKFDTCSKCDFYNTVKTEETGKFKLAATLLGMLR